MPHDRHDPHPAARPRVTIFGPDPLLSVTIEKRGGADDIHVHAAGQGVWVARMAAELGADPVLCCLAGGETGSTLAGLLAAMPGERRVVPTDGASGCYVVDRRDGKRNVVAIAHRPAPRRHEVDDLVAATTAAALGSAALVIANPFPPGDLPGEAFATIAGNAATAGVPVIVDLSSPRLEYTLGCRPAIVKLNDWELAEYVCGPVDGPRAPAAMRRLRDAGARTVVVTRAEEPVLVLGEGDDEPYEIVPPRFTHGFREGCGDAMTGAVAAGLATGLPPADALVLGVAAGAGNFLRHGLGTGTRDVVRELQAQVSVRRAAATSATSAAEARTAG